MKQFPGPSVPLVNMAEELLETVERLQSRLSENQEPRKLQKTLKRLADLPMTVDILVETGVGKTVNSFRKHDLVGDMAKSIVAKWKKLVPQSADRPTPTKDVRSHSLAADISRGHKRVREPSPEEFRHVEDEEEEQMEEEYEHHEQEEEEMEEEEEDQRPMSRYQHGYSPSPPQAYSPTAPGLMGQRLPQYQPTVYDSPQEEPAPSPPRKEPRHSKPHQDPARDHRDRPRDRHSAPGGSEQERRKQSSQSATSSRGVEGKRSGDREQTSSSSSSSTHRPDKHKNSHTSHDRKRTPHDSRKDKKGGSEGRSHVKREEAEPQEEEREEFEAPTMSFESFLTYDAPTPTKKKKKLLKPPPKPAAVAPPPVQPSKPSATNGARSSSKRSEPAAAPITPKPEKRRKVVDVVPTLPDIPLPAIQPNYRPLPSIEHTPVSPQRRKVPVSYEEEDAGFTGRRFNSKMVVYSGAKTSYLPKMMSLYEQCIRVLQNNIDSIDEVGGVPFEILEPVLERCTPEQLYRIEECNQHFMEETDELWMKHCQRDFKRESPQEYESWRELYLRLHDEREERLRMLTQNISSAHANRPKGRQVKMAYVNSVAKPPRDVRRRQEKFGTQAGASSSSANSASPAPVRIKPVMGYSSQSDDAGHSSYSNPPESSRPSVSGGGHSARDKPQVKKIAPMMAKTIKAFKNRFSRR